ncbi:MAG: Ycf66 family protein [Prochloron sp. SP5CPC1]|nr:Ycf66 family protein [Candidatus Paraprochloron terpiosi SP5CPC1]
MVNFGLNSASILGIFLAVAGASLYFMRSVRPELSRDHDIFFAAVGLLCGFILLFQGWRLDPILQFGQFLLAGSTIFFATEAIRLRGVATEQARRRTPIVDEERTVSKVYRNAELDELKPYEEEEEHYEDSPRLRGYPDSSTSRRTGYDVSQPHSRSSRRIRDKYGKGEPTTRKRPRRSSTRSSNGYDRWEESPDVWEEERPSRTSTREADQDRRPHRDKPSRPQKKRSSDDKRRPRYPDREAITTDYVDYNPEESQERNPPRDREGEGDRSNPVNFDY